ncbi:MAG: transcriptional regulator, partial [Spirochaetales bacterium]|nr:transcriptional regulator [Spirochaetales bacterium]
MKHEKEGNKFERMMRILSILSEYRWTSAEELADELGVHKRTVIRYINDINIPFEETGIQLIESSRNGYKLTDSNFLDKLKGIDDQYTIAAINLSPFGKALNIRPVIKKDVLEKILPHLQKPYYIEPEVQKVLLEAFLKNRILEIDYTRNTGEIGHYTILPLKLVSSNGIHYLQCYNYKKEKLVNFTVSKIEKIVTGNICQDRKLIAESLAYIESRWGAFVNDEYVADVVFEVDESLFELLVRNPLHSSQKYENKEGGHVFSLKVHNALEFARWSMRYGWHLDVLEPPLVIDILAGEAERMLEKY